jgi:cytochrome c-type biogenesis protein CcmH/NrfF
VKCSARNLVGLFETETNKKNNITTRLAMRFGLRVRLNNHYDNTTTMLLMMMTMMMTMTIVIIIVLN